MLTASVALFVLQAASSALAGRVCGTTPTLKQKQALEDDFAAKRVNVSGSLSSGRKALADSTIDVHFHVVCSSTSVSGGNIPDGQVQDQIAVLNEAYAGTGLTFQLVNTSRVTNAQWFQSASIYSDGQSAQNAMKQALRQGGADTLNLYSVGFSRGTASTQGLLGYATFPADYESAPWDDGVVFHYSTTPGGTLTPFNLGGTVQHEFGHWTGLYHTFNEGEYENTCTGPGDLIDDTPMEKTATSGCPANADTCPSQPGIDPIHNYMDYSDDDCYTEFTAGQTTRLQDQMATYRGITF